jgi:hypothetical protein
MNRTAVAVAGALFMLSTDPMSGQAQDRGESPTTADPAVSTERVRAALQRPSLLQLPPKTNAAQFRIEIAEDYWKPETALEAVRRWLATEGASRSIILTGSPGSAPPLASVDLLRLAMKLKDTVNATRRARAERNARREVQKAIAEFCAAHDCSILEQDQAGSIQEGVLTPDGK